MVHLKINIGTCLDNNIASQREGLQAWFQEGLEEDETKQSTPGFLLDDYIRAERDLTPVASSKIYFCNITTEFETIKIVYDCIVRSCDSMNLVTLGNLQCPDTFGHECHICRRMSYSWLLRTVHTLLMENSMQFYMLIYIHFCETCTKPSTINTKTHTILSWMTMKGDCLDCYFMC